MPSATCQYRQRPRLGRLCCFCLALCTSASAFCQGHQQGEALLQQAIRTSQWLEASGDNSSLLERYRNLEFTSKELSLKLGQQLKNSMLDVLRGQYQGGSAPLSPGLSYQAVWSTEYWLMEMKYSF